MNNVSKTRIVPSVGLLSELSSNTQRYLSTSYQQGSFSNFPRWPTTQLIQFFTCFQTNERISDFCVFRSNNFSSRYPFVYPLPFPVSLLLFPIFSEPRLHLIRLFLCFSVFVRLRISEPCRFLFRLLRLVVFFSRTYTWFRVSVFHVLLFSLFTSCSYWMSKNNIF